MPTVGQVVLLESQASVIIILALMMNQKSVNILYTTTAQMFRTYLKDEEDENPTTACTSALQTWHKSRLDGIQSQPVMKVVISYPGNNADKLKARRGV